MSDIWNDLPTEHYDDGVRFGTAAEMIAEIKRLRELMSWKTMSTAPKDGSDILIYDGFSIQVVHWICDRFQWGNGDVYGPDYIEPLCWMACPPEPASALETKTP